MDYIKAERVSLKLHPELSERWVQDTIAADPSILGLGEVVVRDKERMQPRAGRLDLLLQDPQIDLRYEVEIQLGGTDEGHISRCIEYCDIERKRYPQYDHCAVLIAEDITSRFLNVVSLFNGTIPLIAMQMQALKVGPNHTLVFTKVMDALSRGRVDEDEEEEVGAPADRAYWENRSNKLTVQLADDLFSIARECEPSLEMRYNRYYIGLSKGGRPYNFVTFQPLKNRINLVLRLEQSDELTARIEGAGLERLAEGARYPRYKLSLQKEDIVKHRELLKELIFAAYQRWAE